MGYNPNLDIPKGQQKQVGGNAINKVLDKIINARLDNRVDHDFIKDLYEFDNYVLEDFIQMMIFILS